MAEEELEEELDDSSDSEIVPSQSTASVSSRINVPYDVFISYSPSEGDWVQNQLLPRIETTGLYVAIEKDRKRKPSKQSLDFWREKLELSRIMLPVFSTNYFKSEYSIRELEIASKEGILIIPILINGFDIVPDELKRIKIHDFSQVFT